MVDRRDCDRYMRAWYKKQNELENQKVINSKLAELQAKRDEVEDTLKYVTMVKELFEQYRDMCILEENAYKKRRKGFIEDYISDILSTIFPDETLTAHIEEVKRNGYNRVELRLTDEQGNVRNPYLTEGQFCQQLIALSAVIATIHNAHANKVYVDEAFAMASPDNLVKASKVLDRIQREGIQAVIISQHAELYRDIFHREIVLDYSTLTGTTRVTSIADYEGVVTDV